MYHPCEHALIDGRCTKCGQRVEDPQCACSQPVCPVHGARPEQKV